MRPGVLSFHSDVLAHRGSLSVQAVFAHAWNLRTPDGWIVTVTTSTYNGPLAVRVGGDSLALHGALPGMEARLEGRSLRVAGAALLLEERLAWNPESLAVGAGGGNARRMPCAPALHTPCLSDLVAPWIWREAGMELSGETERALLDSFRAKDLPAVQRCAFSLLGLGPGLTPQGDDLLCGFLCGLHALGERGVTATALRTFVDEHAPRRTTSLSCTLLRYAGRGVAAEPLLDVLCSLECGDCSESVDRLLTIGHSSGRAMLTGALLAAAAVWGLSFA